jgi:hypothetical protein
VRIRTGHKPEDWTTSTPASTGSSRLGGQLVVGGPGSVEMGRIQSRANNKALRGERLAERIAAHDEVFLASKDHPEAVA